MALYQAMRRIPRRRLHQAGALPAVLSVEIPCNQRVDFVAEVVPEGVTPVIDKLTGYQVDIGTSAEDPAGLAVADILTVYPCARNIAGVVVIALKAESFRVEIQALSR